MEVILKEDVEHLGHRGDVVKVADGYGRNYLLPHKLAMQANAANKAVIDEELCGTPDREGKGRG
jgi:large subunit ribosomal protein L9